ncbi:uncharacterized protein LOC130814286 isoform X2 [Amaranthus tricolor]|uniref:uncharacterized protein LOC130814286 isoform X2 n=1 Tax=Amaranthus tricolor TaxID=29722 RepID=UPI00258F9723|nr:uncharacterized protein LOC130814286 isoform X2 [Amaranthus tricolor]
MGQKRKCRYQQMWIFVNYSWIYNLGFYVNFGFVHYRFRKSVLHEENVVVMSRFLHPNMFIFAACQEICCREDQSPDGRLNLTKDKEIHLGKQGN